MAVAFWFRRDLRLVDNTALNKALYSGQDVLPIFIFDQNILDELEKDDPRVTFIHQQLAEINRQLRTHDSGLIIRVGNPDEIWSDLITEFDIDAVYINKDYEPYALHRDKAIESILKSKGIPLYAYKDQVIFEAGEILKSDGRPYTVFTPYKKRWLSHFSTDLLQEDKPEYQQYYKHNEQFPSLREIGFESSKIAVLKFKLDHLDNYQIERNFPAIDSTSKLSPHLRFGTVSVRQIIKKIDHANAVFLSELIWREFFMQILYHYPHVVHANFRSKYDGISWRNNEAEFELWCQGKTGYPLVDAGMRQLNETGYMHNRVRMVTASFLCKHLLIDWRWGEAYFAKKLLDFDLSANNGNWQWAAGTGCDAAPYFRVFNPLEQQKKYDPEFLYVRKWLPEIDSFSYPQPIVEHKFARERALSTYKKGIDKMLNSWT